MGSCRLGVAMVRPPILLLIIGCAQAIPRGGLHRQSFHLPPIKPDGDHPFTITVEGNVGAGKSTLLNFFGLYPEVAVHKEPLSIWKNLNGSDFLGKVMERSLFSCRHVFIENLAPMLTGGEVAKEVK